MGACLSRQQGDASRSSHTALSSYTHSAGWAGSAPHLKLRCCSSYTSSPACPALIAGPGADQLRLHTSGAVSSQPGEVVLVLSSTSHNAASLLGGASADHLLPTLLHWLGCEGTAASQQAQMQVAVLALVAMARSPPQRGPRPEGATVKMQINKPWPGCSNHQTINLSLQLVLPGPELQVTLQPLSAASAANSLVSFQQSVAHHMVAGGHNSSVTRLLDEEASLLASKSVTWMDHVAASRAMLVNDALPSGVTLLATQEGTLLSQNQLSLDYFGPLRNRLALIGSCLPPTNLPSLAQLPAMPDLSVAHTSHLLRVAPAVLLLLRLLLVHEEPGDREHLLADLLQGVVLHGQTWKHVTKVPIQLAETLAQIAGSHTMPAAISTPAGHPGQAHIAQPPVGYKRPESSDKDDPIQGLILHAAVAPWSMNTEGTTPSALLPAVTGAHHGNRFANSSVPLDYHARTMQNSSSHNSGPSGIAVELKTSRELEQTAQSQSILSHHLQQQQHAYNRPSITLGYAPPQAPSSQAPRSMDPPSRRVLSAHEPRLSHTLLTSALTVTPRSLTGSRTQMGWEEEIIPSEEIDDGDDGAVAPGPLSEVTRGAVSGPVRAVPTTTGPHNDRSNRMVYKSMGGTAIPPGPLATTFQAASSGSAQNLDQLLVRKSFTSFTTGPNGSPRDGRPNPNRATGGSRGHLKRLTSLLHNNPHAPTSGSFVQLVSTDHNAMHEGSWHGPNSGLNAGQRTAATSRNPTETALMQPGSTGSISQAADLIELQQMRQPSVVRFNDIKEVRRQSASESFDPRSSNQSSLHPPPRRNGSVTEWEMRSSIGSHLSQRARASSYRGRSSSGLAHEPSASQLGSVALASVEEDWLEQQAVLLTQGICWHELCVKQVEDPSTGRPALLLVQHNVTDHARMEEQISAMTEAQLAMLSQIFPRHVIELLQTQASSSRGMDSNALSSLARQHSCATILFMDLVGFTSMSKELAPTEVISFLNALFTDFDYLVHKHGVHKIDTLGDAFLLGAGVLVPDQDGFNVCDDDGDPVTNASRVFQCAKDMLRVSQQMRMPTGEPLRIRIGIHSGACVSGVVGQQLPKWTVLGDTPNTASRMESTATPGTVHLTSATYNLLAETGEHQDLQGPKAMDIKGKGQMMTYVFVPPSDPEWAILPPDFFEPLHTNRPAEANSRGPLLLTITEGSSAEALAAERHASSQVDVQEVSGQMTLSSDPASLSRVLDPEEAALSSSKAVRFAPDAVVQTAPKAQAAQPSVYQRLAWGSLATPRLTQLAPPPLVLPPASNQQADGGECESSDNAGDTVIARVTGQPFATPRAVPFLKGAASMLRSQGPARRQSGSGERLRLASDGLPRAMPSQRTGSAGGGSTLASPMLQPPGSGSGLFQASEPGSAGPSATYRRCQSGVETSPRVSHGGD